MRYLLSTVTLFLLLLAGCATRVPPFDVPNNDAGHPTVRTIRDRIVCELDQLAMSSEMNQYLLKTNDVDVALQLTLDVTEDGGLAPTFTYTNGIFAFSGGATYDRSREQSITIQLFYSMQQLRRNLKIEFQDGARRDPVCSPKLDTDLSGVIGLKDAFDLATTAGTNLNWKGSGTSGAFGGYVNFVVKRELTATGPTWTLTHFKGPGSLATLSSNTNDKLVYAFTQGKDAGPGEKPKPEAKAAGLAVIYTVILGQQATSLDLIRSSTQ